ncbi:hypothetical protein F383_10452 [Gossypium arboreum]|uniref:Uncharacterized protein n=1 Tax=Gossypium arboreum TaxID=29729 RepID=A0A0B0P322_GOSAR|nr:hypothetical protein F383_10452 [Gossypium arboreum]
MENKRFWNSRNPNSRYHSGPVRDTGQGHGRVLGRVKTPSSWTRKGWRTVGV